MAGPLLAGVVAWAVVYALSRTVRERPAERDGRRWVEYGLAYKAMGAAFFPLSAFVSSAAAQASDDQKALAGAIALAFWAGTLYLAYEFFFVSLSYDDASIYHRSPLRGPRHIPWSSVTDMRYSPLTQAFTLLTDGADSVTVSPMADGAREMIERAASQLGRDE